MLAWALARELEQLLMLRLACDHGQALGPLLEKARVWSSRQALYQQALQRLTTERLHQLIAVTVQLDRAIRRFETEEAWLLLQSVSGLSPRCRTETGVSVKPAIGILGHL